MPATRQFIDMLMILISADHVVEVLMLGAELLQIGEEPEAWIADGKVHEPALVGDPPGRRGPRRRGEDDEVAAALTTSHHPDLSLDQHLLVSDPVGLPLKPGE